MSTNTSMTSYRPFDRRKPPTHDDGLEQQVMMSSRVTRSFKSDVKAYAANHQITVQDMMHDALMEYMQRHM